MKSKICILVLVVIMLFSATACGGAKASAYSTYTAAMEKMENASAVEIKLSSDMTLTMAGQTTDITMDGVVKQKTISDTEVELSAVMSTNTMGMSIDMTTYFADGYYYLEMMGLKYKIALPLEDALAQAQTSTPEFEESAIKENTMTDKDGGKEVTFVLDGAVMSDMVQDQLAGLGDMGETEDLDMTYGDVTVTSFIDKDGNMKTSSVQMSFEMSMQGMTIPMEMTMNMEYIAFDDDVTIDVPADLDSFIVTARETVGI